MKDSVPKDGSRAEKTRIVVNSPGRSLAKQAGKLFFIMSGGIQLLANIRQNRHRFTGWMNSPAPYHPLTRPVRRSAQNILPVHYPLTGDPGAETRLITGFLRPLLFPGPANGSPADQTVREVILIRPVVNYTEGMKRKSGTATIFACPQRHAQRMETNHPC